MKPLLLVAIFTSILLTSRAQDMQQYLSDTKEMVTQKKYDEALERYIWFQNHALEYNRAMVGVRLSFALADWKALADMYPTAMTALQEMRNHKTKLLLDSNAAVAMFADVAAINRTLAEESKTVELFQRMAANHPAKAASCWYWAKDVLFDAKRYDIIRNYIGSPVNEFTMIESQYQMTKKFQENGDAHVPELKVFNDDNLVKQSLQLMQFSIAINDATSAKVIQQKVMAIVNDHRLADFKID